MPRWTRCIAAAGVAVAMFGGGVGAAAADTDSDQELTGLVYSLTPRQADAHLAWYQRPATLGVVVLGLTLLLNIIFW